MEASLPGFKTPSKIFLVGFMGTGKTHWGKIWADANQMNFVDLDDVIESTQGKLIADIFYDEGEEHFREIEATALRSCGTLANTIIASGGGTPCFHGNMAWMNEQGITIYIKTEPRHIYERVVAEKDKRPLFRKLDASELLSFIEMKLYERNEFYTQATYTLDSERVSPHSLQEIISTHA